MQRLMRVSHLSPFLLSTSEFFYLISDFIPIYLRNIIDNYSTYFRKKKVFNFSSEHFVLYRQTLLSQFLSYLLLNNLLSTLLAKWKNFFIFFFNSTLIGTFLYINLLFIKCQVNCMLQIFVFLFLNVFNFFLLTRGIRK